MCGHTAALPSLNWGAAFAGPKQAGLEQEAESGPWSGLKCTGEPPRVLLIYFPGSQDCEECHLLLEKPDGMLTLLLVTIMAVMGGGPGTVVQVLAPGSPLRDGRG